MTFKVSAAVLHWQSPNQAIRAVRSLQHSTGVAVDVIIIDNGSSDLNYSLLANNLEGIRIVRSARNLGYAGGMNLALQVLREESAEYILLMTQDVIVERNMLWELLRTMLDNPSVGIAGPVVYYFERRDEVFSAGGYVDVKRLKVNHYLSPRSQAPYEVDWIDGCCMLIRRQAIDDAGDFDDAFFMYYEENDLCQRVERCGWKVVVVPSARAWHEVGRGPRSFNYHYYMVRNSYLYWAKNFGVGLLAVARRHVLTLAKQYAATFISLVSPKLRNRRGFVARVIDSLRATKGFILGSWDYLRNFKR